MQTQAHKTVLLLVSLLLISCAGSVRHDRGQHEAPALPNRFSNTIQPQLAMTETIAIDAPGEKPVAHPLDHVLTEWWRLWGNEELDSLVDSALVHNPDLRIASWRIAQLEARARQARGAKAPVLSLPVEVRHAAPYGELGMVPRGAHPTPRDLYRLGLRADWRPDLWGEMGSLEESAELRLWQATFQRDDMQRAVVAAVIRDYLEYLALNDRLRVARESEAGLSALLKAVETRMRMGDATIIDYEQQRAAVFGIRANIPVLEQQRDHVTNRLAMLTGIFPGSLNLSDAGLTSLTLPAVLPGLPSSLLLRRPDVRAVESRLIAAGADIDVARARILPPLDLTAQAGYASRHLGQLFQPHTLFYNAVASLAITLFDNRRRADEIVFAEAVHAEMVETYLRVISQAVREVDDALIAMQMLEWRMGEQQAAIKASHNAYQHSLVSYRAGDIDQLTLLIVENTLHKNQDELLIAHQARYQRLNDLFAALGGGIALHGMDNARWEPWTGEILDDGRVVFVEHSPPDAVAAETKDAFAATAERVSGVMSLEEADQQLGEAPNDIYLVELSGIHDRQSVGAAGRNLFQRLPHLKESHFILPQQQGRIEGAEGERASWYRLWLYRFEDLDTAEAACLELQHQQIRCRVATAQEVKKKGRTREYVSRRTHESQARVVILQESAEISHFAVQLGAFRDLANAERMVEAWVERGYDVAAFQTTASFGTKMHVVRMGRFSSMHEAAGAARSFNDQETQNAIPVRVRH